jgi:hypothetical protein
MESFEMKFQSALLALASSLLIASPVLADAESDVVAACKPDVERLCKGIQPGGGKIIECLKKQEKQISVGCAQAVKKAKTG